MPGRYKIFLGMAAGVGKTYRMLAEAQAQAEAGRDVVIGLLETHRRAETEAMAQGLEVIPRRRVPYRGVTLEEMDVPGILRRAPELCLIDELAHTNAPGVEHPKRYDDIADVRAAGIDVYSTVNVQHLESLNDQVAELTGVRVRETVPDEELEKADEVVLIDLPPEDLVARLRDGKVYDPARVPAALNGFFRVENLQGPAGGRAAAGRGDRRGQKAGRAADRGAPAGVRHARRSGRTRRPQSRPVGGAAQRRARRAGGARPGDRGFSGRARSPRDAATARGDGRRAPARRRRQ